MHGLDVLYMQVCFGILSLLFLSRTLLHILLFICYALIRGERFIVFFFIHVNITP